MADENTNVNAQNGTQEGANNTNPATATAQNELAKEIGFPKNPKVFKKRGGAAER